MVLTKIPGGLITDSSITSADIQDSTITNSKLVNDPSNASNLNSGSVPAAQLTLAPDPDLSEATNDIALLAFKTQANGNLARYNLVDQSVDAFEDQSGVDTQGAVTRHTVTAVGTTTWTAPTNVSTVTYLGVAGGGGGAGWGGGGAGGYRTGNLSVTAGNDYTITVGDGGAIGNNTTAGTNGGNSVFSTITSAGGGGGGSGAGSAGGSGGGAQYTYGSGGAGNTPSTSPAQGYAGGGGTHTGTGSGTLAGGGGGGSSEVGETGVTNVRGGTGGDGTVNDISGANVTYAGGGGGGGDGRGSTAGGPAGTGGGGAGSNGGTATAGTANTGGGGGGSGIGSPGYGTAGAGGSGIVILKWQPDGASTNETYNSAGKYFSGAVAATGGTKTQVTISDTVYDLFTFTEDGTLTSGAAANVDILVVGGGGSGG